MQGREAEIQIYIPVIETYRERAREWGRDTRDIDFVLLRGRGKEEAEAEWKKFSEMILVGTLGCNTYQGAM